jgi:hypothetical protein|tara:strand:- start:670 stop:1047 length:378 start_codon:yes stop_codon:yes gene_type:complete
MTTKVESLKSVRCEVMRSKKIGNNTFEVVYTDGSRAIRLHKTDIVTFIDGVIILDTNGWETVTTKARMNDYIPTSLAHVYQSKHIWYVTTANDGDILYYDGIKLDYNGNHITYDQHDNLVNGGSL